MEPRVSPAVKRRKEKGRVSWKQGHSQEEGRRQGFREAAPRHTHQLLLDSKGIQAIALQASSGLVMASKFRATW